MKHSELPFHIDNSNMGKILIKAKDDPATLAVGHIYLPEDAAYIKKACNHYERAIELLVMCRNAVSIALMEDGNCATPTSSFAVLLKDLDNFLNEHVQS